MSHYGLADVNQRLFLIAISREALAVMLIDQSKNFKKKLMKQGLLDVLVSLTIRH